jgi:hypothetical protein
VSSPYIDASVGKSVGVPPVILPVGFGHRLSAGSSRVLPLLRARGYLIDATNVQTSERQPVESRVQTFERRVQAFEAFLYVYFEIVTR